MAVATEIVSNAGRVLVNIGTTASGAVRTANVSIGTLSVNGWDNGKFVNIVEALKPCLAENYEDSQHIQTTSVYYEADD